MLHILKQKENVPTGTISLENNHKRHFLSKADLEMIYLSIYINRYDDETLLVYLLFQPSDHSYWSPLQ